MLKGARVLLRAVERRDINIFYDIWSYEEVRKLDVGFILPPSKEWILENFNEFMTSSKKYLSIVNEKGVVIGYITYEEAKDCPCIYSLGITIARNFWNRGYGQDAIKTLLKFLFMCRGAERVELEVASFNIRAMACYGKCGFVQEGIKRNRHFMDGKYENLTIMGIIKKEFMV